MNFRMRLILSYTVLALIASLLLGSIYSNLWNQRSKSTIYNNMQFTSSQILNQVDTSVSQMENATLQLLSDPESLTAIRELSTLMGNPKGHELAISEDRSLIRNTLYTAFNLENFYRVVVFNPHGYIGASAVMQDRFVNPDVDVASIPWLAEAKDTKGDIVILGVHPDDWGTRNPEKRVFSVVKEIQGNQLGYIEVQQTEEYLAGLFQVPTESIGVIALKSNDEVLYATDNVKASQYQQYFSWNNQVSEQFNERTQRNELISVQTAKLSNVKLLLVQDWDLATGNTPSGFSTALLIGLIFLSFSLCFIVIMANKLTKPMRQLRQQMESTELANMTKQIKIDSSDTDVQALTRTYQNLMKRLETSSEKEKKLSILQLQAQFDTLQAQVNPHFLYNVLNAISNRGMQDDDEVICDICGNLAAMLRYSTNVKERYATVDQEITYLKNYSYLLQARFEDRLKFEVMIEEEIKRNIVPKISIQQLVENAIEHGFQNSVGEMLITVKGYATETGWRVEVIDNGSGITSDKKDEIKENMIRIREKIEQKNQNLEFEIGGMGLANVYGRMYLLYQDSVVFEIENTQESGTKVVIGVSECIQ
ncbi:MAG: histidine kinase [Hespellia sp.]|nr:histidine kinase [Hespellia sp.]